VTGQKGELAKPIVNSGIIGTPTYTLKTNPHILVLPALGNTTIDKI